MFLATISPSRHFEQYLEAVIKEKRVRATYWNVLVLAEKRKVEHNSQRFDPLA